MTELAHAAWTEYSCNSFMADRMGLDSTMLHYLAVRKAMVSVHRPIHSKITLTYSLTWQTDRFTPQRMAFKALLNTKAALSWALLKVFSAAYYSKKLPERAPTKKQLRVLSIIDQLRAWAHRRSAYAQLSPLYPSLYPYVTHVINIIPGPLPLFRTASDGKLGGAWERG